MSTGDNNKQHLLSRAAERLKRTNVCRAPATPHDAKSDLLGKTLMLGKIEGGRRRGRQRVRWLDDITDSMDMGLSKLQGMVKQGSLVCYSPWGHKELDTTEQLN